MPKEAEKSTLKFWNESAEGYKKSVEKELENKDDDDRWVGKIFDNAPKKDRLRILDVGTGPGFFTINFARLGHDVTGIDISRGMITAAKENAEKFGVKCDFRLMNANRLEFPDDSFDLIISRMVTWTLPDLFECYREWRRALAPNGRIIVFDGNHYANLFSEGRAKTMRLSMREHLVGGGEPYTDHFDFHVRWTYWEERPMIGTPRPEWDRNMLLKLRFVDIVVDDEVFPDLHPDGGTSGPTFMVRAEKPSPDEENDYIVNEYWNAISGCVSARAVKMLDGGFARAYAEAVAVHLPEKGRVLDIGTGSGAAAIPLAETGFDVTGIDRAAAMIDMAKLTAEERKSRAEFQKADAEYLPFDGGSFDAAVLRNVLWNSYRPKNILKEAARILRRGGVLVITDGGWQGAIEAWESAHDGSPAFPNCKKRDLGLGAYDVIDAYYGRLPLNIERRPAWDRTALEGCGLSVGFCDEFEDPMITEDLRPVLGKGFMVVARKP